MADAAAWTEAVGTVGAFATGLMLFAGQIADRRRTHASRVAVWTATEADGRRRTYRLNVRNDGEQPIHDCYLQSELALTIPHEDENPLTIGSEIARSFGVVAPGDHVANVVFFRVGDVMPKDRPDDLVGIGMGDVDPSVELDDLVNRGLRFRVSFADAEGRAWFRDERGRLRRTHSRRHQHVDQDTSGSPYVSRGE